MHFILAFYNRAVRGMQFSWVALVLAVLGTFCHVQRMALLLFHIGGESCSERLSSFVVCLRRSMSLTAAAAERRMLTCWLCTQRPVAAGAQHRSVLSLPPLSPSCRHLS